MLTAMQQGSFYKRHGAWHVVYRITEVVDGAPVRKQKTKRLGAIENGEKTPPNHLLVRAQEILAPVNLGSATPEGAITVADFAQRFFLPTIEARRKPSTKKFYTDLVKNHIEPLLGNLRLQQVTTRDVQRMLDVRRNLSQQSVLRIKTGASAILSTAIRMGYINGPNAAREARAEGQRKKTDDEHAHTLPEVFIILKRLPEPARTVVATAAYTGLRESELRGLQWEDYDGEFLHVRRAVWRTHVGDTKTPESRNAVPVIEPLRKILDAHRRRNGVGKWIFAGEKMGRPLHLDNLSRRVIRPAVGDLWHGWHAFRRGLVTILFDLGVQVETASLLARHANVSITQEHYLMLKSRKQGRAAMRKLGSKVRRMLDTKNRRSCSTPRQ